MGADALVPPQTVQPVSPYVWYTATPVYGSATADTSASPRPVRVVLPVCQVGFDSYAEQPEPEPFQADSVQPRAVPLRVSEVPPTVVTYRDEAGNSAPQPLSPALAVMATPGWFRYDWSTSVSRHRLVDGGEHVAAVAAAGFHEQDPAARAGRGHHVHVKGDLAGPPGVSGGQGAGLTVLVDLPEAPVGGGTRGQPELRPVHREIGLGGRVVVRVDDGDGRARVADREPVGALQVGRTVPGRRDPGAEPLPPDDVLAAYREARHLAGLSRLG